MTNNEEFEKLAGCEGFDLHQWTPGCYSDEKTAGAFEGYQMRQPEIDALIFDRKMTRSLYSNASREIERLRDENAALKAEVERLRKEVANLNSECIEMANEIGGEPVGFSMKTDPGFGPQ